MRGRSATAMVCATVIAVALCASAASAQDAEEIEARGLFEAGRVAFGDGRFEEALERFQRSYELSSRPTLLYNIASAHDRLGNVTDAIEAYERYLAEMPEPENRSFVEARLRILGEQAERAAQDAQADADAERAAQARDVADEGTPAVPSSRSATGAPARDEGPAIAAAVLLSLAGLTGGAGIGLGAYSMALRADLESRCVALVCAPADRSDVDTLATTALLADVMLGASLATAVGGVIALILAIDQPSGDASVTVAVSPSAFGARLRARF